MLSIVVRCLLCDACCVSSLLYVDYCVCSLFFVVVAFFKKFYVFVSAVCCLLPVVVFGDY